LSADLTICARNGAPSLATIDVQRAVELRRVKTLANVVLAGSLAVLLLARMMMGRHPAFGFVTAFAEAAVIGGLADWYAVVAIFRHPLGLPIPHTAIIPSNQRRIGERLGQSAYNSPPILQRCNQINRAVVNIASSTIAEHKTGISSFIADQVKAWDTGQLVNLIENNVGKDLQYIRFNGALIGGLCRPFALFRRSFAPLC
jgi:uncharacterized membrane-anchored protein YjiN (DUF445 family)